MAVYLSNGVQVTFDSTNISDWVSSVTLNRNYDELEVTTMGSTGHEFIAGLEASSITLEIFNDFAASASMTLIDGAVGTLKTIKVKPAAGATSSTNPEYTMTVLVNNVTPINGTVADLATSSLTFNVSGAISKSTTP